ncbi:hypothetical protein [Spirosoma endophyticum]|uniref:Uncharacterized protein n=1 Tax=Spirosoma endophyticum TaxID=662367 RepID=A0A1I2BAI3_9BACT|nr:hypothetical protein [Spirosoma endophyticum]SFE52908.1 hypothetical protein SAMN05216167_11536 [Spirosoma endophyticum]
MQVPHSVYLCLLGGATLQLLNLIDALSAPPDRRPDFRSVAYYLAIVFNLALSAILGYVYFDETTQKLNKMVYFHVGLSAPLILRSLATTIPEIVRKSNPEIVKKTSED